MCNVNFVNEHNLFMRYARNNQLTGRERLLWMALFTIANDRANYNSQTKSFEWPDTFFPVTNGELSLHSTLDKRGIESVRDQLRHRGLIDFEKGNGNTKPPRYKLNYLSIDVGYKIVPNNVPDDTPNNVPMNGANSAPDNVPMNDPIYIDINKGLNNGLNNGVNTNQFYSAADDRARAGTENAVNDFLAWNGQDFGRQFGVTDAMQAEAARITEQIFGMYCVRPAAGMDTCYVLNAVKEYDMARQTHYLSSDKVKLLTYCFEQAFLNGNPGNWKYVMGCMKRLNERGIRSLDDLEDYEEGVGA